MYDIRDLSQILDKIFVLIINYLKSIFIYFPRDDIYIFYNTYY